MKKKFIILLISPLLCAKNILILTSKGGGAHTSATAVIQDALQHTKHHVIVKNTLTDMMPGFSWFSGQAGIDAESMFNMLLKKNETYLIDLFASFGLALFPRLTPFIVPGIEQFLRENAIDLVISVMPAINNFFLIACKKLNIPFLVVPLDLDLSIYFPGGVPEPYDKLFVSLPLKHHFLSMQIDHLSLDPRHIYYLGFPLRKQFFVRYKKKDVLDYFGFPDDKKIILVMMGGAGSMRSLYFVQQIVRYMQKPVHIVCCIGHNPLVEEKLENLSLPPGTSMSIIPFTEHVAALMSVADLFITKSGPTSLFEAMQKKLPILVDALTDVVMWEKPNLFMVESLGIGDVLYHTDDTTSLIENLLFDERYRREIQERYARYSHNVFYKHINKVVEDLLTLK